MIFNLISCQPKSYFKTANSSTTINNAFSNHSQVDSLIQPYKTKLDVEMNEVLIISSEEFPKEKGKAETKLGNLVANLSLEIAQKMYTDTIDFCLLNFGGLRTSLPKGDVTRGKIFELMPFENELVVVTISQDKMSELVKYLKEIGGQPVSGFQFNFSKKLDNIVMLTKNESDSVIINEYKVLTSDYLANGGDNMNFFLNRIKVEPIGIKMRDAIIQYCKQENQKGNQLTGKLDGRITFE